MEQVSLQRDLWTGLVVPQQVWILLFVCIPGSTRHTRGVFPNVGSFHTQHEKLSVQVEQGLKTAQQLVSDGSCPWAIVSVWGVTGQPVSWLETPANKSMPMDQQNDYSICILPQNEYILMVASGSADPFQTV